MSLMVEVKAETVGLKVDTSSVRAGQIYRHYSGKCYEILAIGIADL